MRHRPLQDPQCILSCGIGPVPGEVRVELTIVMVVNPSAGEFVVPCVLNCILKRVPERPAAGIENTGTPKSSAASPALPGVVEGQPASQDFANKKTVLPSRSVPLVLSKRQPS